MKVLVLYSDFSLNGNFLRSSGVRLFPQPPQELPECNLEGTDRLRIFPVVLLPRMAKVAAPSEGQFLTVVLEGSGGPTWN